MRNFYKIQKKEINIRIQKYIKAGCTSLQYRICSPYDNRDDILNNLINFYKELGYNAIYEKYTSITTTNSSGVLYINWEEDNE